MDSLSGCQRCPRLAAYLGAQQLVYPGYHNRPVAAIGAADARLLIVGLAPGLHGANATGRPFSGDASGRLLFATLQRHGFAGRGDDDGDEFELHDCRITNAVKCAPPANRPRGDEIRRCNDYLRAEIASLRPGSVILALGGIAHRAIIGALGQKQSRFGFAHGAEHRLPGALRVCDSYHCSRYNVNTGRLTQTMFDAVLERIRGLLS